MAPVAVRIPRLGRPGQARRPAGQAKPGQAQARPRPRAARPRPAAGERSRGLPSTAPLPDADRLTRLLEPVVHALDMDLEGIRVTAAGRRRILRVVVDADGGVSLDDIALASRELSLKLDGAAGNGRAALHPRGVVAWRRPAADPAAPLAPRGRAAGCRAADGRRRYCSGRERGRHSRGPRHRLDGQLA